MSKDVWGVIRGIALILMIALVSIADSILWWQQQYWWAVFWLWIIVSVAGFEIASYIAGRKTISTRWTEFTKTNRNIAYTALFILSLAMLCLWIHLAFFGSMFD